LKKIIKKNYLKNRKKNISIQTTLTLFLNDLKTMKNNNLQTPEVIDLVIANIITDEERKN
jgi:hypothetical protein